MSVNAKEFMAIKRSNSTNTATKTLTFKNCISIMQKNEYMNANGELESGPMGVLSKWSRIEIGFAQRETDANGKTVREGGRGSINIDCLDDLYMKTQYLQNKIIDYQLSKMTASTAENTDTLSELETIVSYLPRDMVQGKGMTAIQIAKMFSITQVVAAANNLEAQVARGGKFAESNQLQADSLLIAMLVANRDKDFIKPTVAECFTSGQREFLAACDEYYKNNDRNDEGCIYIEAMRKLLKAKKIDSRVFKVNDTAGTTGGYIELYSVFKTPNVRKIEERYPGYTKAYEIKISANPMKDYPYRIELTTMLGKPRTDKSGNVKDVGIDVKAGVINKKQFVMDLDSKEWTKAIRKMVAMRDGMMDLGFRAAFNEADKLERQAAMAARAVSA